MNEKKAYNQLDHSGTYREDDTSVTLTVLGGTYGGVGGTYRTKRATEKHRTPETQTKRRDMRKRR